MLWAQQRSDVGIHARSVGTAHFPTVKLGTHANFRTPCALDVLFLRRDGAGSLIRSAASTKRLVSCSKKLGHAYHHRRSRGIRCSQRGSTVACQKRSLKSSNVRTRISGSAWPNSRRYSRSSRSSHACSNQSTSEGYMQTAYGFTGRTRRIQRSDPVRSVIAPGASSDRTR